MLQKENLRLLETLKQAGIEAEPIEDDAKSKKYRQPHKPALPPKV